MLLFSLLMLASNLHRQPANQKMTKDNFCETTRGAVRDCEAAHLVTDAFLCTLYDAYVLMHNRKSQTHFSQRFSATTM